MAWLVLVHSLRAPRWIWNHLQPTLRATGAECRGRASRWAGSRCNKQGSYMQGLSGAGASRSGHRPARALTAYREAPRRISHTHRPSGLSTALSQRCIFSMALIVGMVGEMLIWSTGEDVGSTSPGPAGRPTISHEPLITSSNLCMKGEWVHEIWPSLKLFFP